MVVFTLMATCFDESAIQELGRTMFDEFDRRIRALPPDLCAPFHAEARQLESELLMLYRATVLCVKREEDMDKVSARWAEMVDICNGSLSRLSQLSEKHPGCGANIYYDRALDLRNKCQRLHEMHK